MVICIVVSHLGGGGAEHVATMLANGFADKDGIERVVLNILTN